MLQSRILVALCSLIVTIAAGHAAAAQEAFSAFRRLCLETDGSSERVLQAADASGWTFAPNSFVDGMASSLGATGVQGRMERSSSGTYIVLTGLIPSAGGPEFEADLCVIYGFDLTKNPAFMNEIEQWVGLKPLRQTQGRSVLWSYVTRDRQNFQPHPDTEFKEPLNGISALQDENGFQLEFTRIRLRSN